VSELEKAIGQLKYDSDGLLPAVVVDHETGKVLMVAYVNQTALLETIRTRKTHFWSRSRRKYWMKGESSGHVQEVKAIYTDCDADTVLIEVVPRGPACHEGYYSCFHRRLSDNGEWQVVAEKLFDPDEVYGKGRK